MRTIFLNLEIFFCQNICIRLEKTWIFNFLDLFSFKLVNAIINQEIYN